jgi:mannose-6-phosphate isomerase-like protein (cupin superfamily)
VSTRFDASKTTVDGRRVGSCETSVREEHGVEPPRSLENAFASFDDLWEPRIVATVNDYDVKVAKVEGEYHEHAHPDTDEYFQVLAGELTIELPDLDQTVALSAGDVYVVPRGVRHRPIARPGTRILMFEPRGTLNSGDSGQPGTEGKRA